MTENYESYKKFGELYRVMCSFSLSKQGFDTKKDWKLTLKEMRNSRGDLERICRNSQRVILNMKKDKRDCLRWLVVS